MFRGKLPEEKASLVQLAGVCALCLDWTRDHKAEDCQAKADGTLKEEQAKEAVLKTVVMFGQKIAACERSSLAKTEAKVTEKVEQEN